MLPNTKTLFFTALLSAGLLASPVLACGDKPDISEENLHLQEDHRVKMNNLIKLGITPDAFNKAIEAAGGTHRTDPDLAVAAKLLGVSESALNEALSRPPGNE